MAEEAISSETTGNTGSSAAATTPSTGTPASESAPNSVATQAATSTTGATNASTKEPANAPASPATLGAAAGKPASGVGGKANAKQPSTPAPAPVSAQPKTPQAGDDQPVTRAELNAYFAERQAASEAAVARTNAVNSHQSTLASQVETIRAKAADAFAVLPEELREPLINATLQKYDDARLQAAYPEGHPLHGEVCGVLDQAGIDAVVKTATDLKTKIQASNLLRVGQGANAFRPSVAGNQAAQGQAAPEQRRETLETFLRNKVTASMNQV